jgi:flagellar hook-basal body complex protein FliE
MTQFNLTNITNTSPEIGRLGPAGPIQREAGAPPAGRFADVLKKSLDEVNQLQLDAEKAVNALATGKTDNVAEVMTAVQKADLAFKTMLQIRNKLLDAYNEVRQMRI